MSDVLPLRQASPEVERIDLGVLARIKAEKLQPIDVVRTPWPSWNRLCGNAGGGEGLAHGWHVIVGASSGAGKSLCATNIAATAVRGGEHVCLISLEMGQEEIVTRLMAIYANEEIRRLEHGRRFDRHAWDRASDAFVAAPGSLRINHEPVGTLGEIMQAMDKALQEGCRTFIIDYLQLAWVRDADTMIQQITEVSHTIRLFAKQNRVLTVGLSQVNRATSGTGGELRKEGLLGGSSLENDADQVLLLGKPKPAGSVYHTEVKLDKNRQGPPGDWAMELDPRSLRMRDILPDEETSVPA